MQSLFQKVVHHYTNKLPFVVYCKPNSDVMIGVFQHDTALHLISDFTESGFVFVSFDGEEKYFIPSESSDVYVQKISSDAFQVSKNTAITANDIEKKSFESLVKKGIEAIENKAFHKVVLSRKETVEISNLDIESLLNGLRFNYPNAFNYCFFHPKIGMWIGATPEQFLQTEDVKIKTVALAGTQLFSQSIQWKSKEKKEQEFVTDFIVSNLKEYCTAITVSDPYTTKAGTIAHIKTDITAELNSKNDLGKLIEKLHPTPAVCGLPKEIAKQFILKNEGYNRKFYSGFLGELNIDFRTFKKDNSDLFVNLRCMEVEKNTATIYVGCGITKESIPEMEYIETVNKSMTIRKVVNLQINFTK